MPSERLPHAFLSLRAKTTPSMLSPFPSLHLPPLLSQPLILAFSLSLCPRVYHRLPATKHAAAATALRSLRLSLHLLADLDIDLEELGYAAVEAHGLALVEIGLAVRGVYAFGCAGFDEAVRLSVLASLGFCWTRVRWCVEVGVVVGWGQGKGKANGRDGRWGGIHTDCTYQKPCQSPPRPAQSFAPKRFVVFDRRTWTCWAKENLCFFLPGSTGYEYRFAIGDCG